MKKTTKKKSASRSRKPAAKKTADVDLRDVRQKVKNLIGGQAEELAGAVAAEALQKAQVQTMKVLFEMIGLFPESKEERQAAADDQSLAKLLLEQIGIADDSSAANEEEAAEPAEIDTADAAALLEAAVPVE